MAVAKARLSLYRYLKYGDNMEQEMQSHFAEYIDNGAHVITYAQVQSIFVTSIL